MKKILLTIAAAFMAATSFAQTGEPDWTKTGVATPYSDWTGFCDETYIGTTFTVKGWEEEKTIQITDAYGTTMTITNDAEEYITKMNGTDVKRDSYDYVSNYFAMGTIYYAAFTPGYSSYALCDENEGYACLSGYFYDERDSQKANWGYVYITWDENQIKDVKQISWTTLATPRYSTAAQFVYYNSDHMTAGAETPVVVAYTDDTYKVFSFAGVKGYDLSFGLDGNNKMIVTDCEDHNSAETLHRVSTGLTTYDRLGIYNNGSSYDYNTISMDPNHGYINFQYAVGYTPVKPSSGKYPYICYGLSWYNTYYTAKGAASTYGYDNDGNVVYNDTILVNGTDSLNILRFRSDSLYVIPQYLGAGSGDLWFKANADNTISIQAVPFGYLYESGGYTYDYYYNGKAENWISYYCAADSSYAYSQLSGTIGYDYEQESTDDGYVYFFCYEGAGSQQNTSFFYALDWSKVVETELWTVVGSKAIMNGDSDWNQAEAANDMTSTDGTTYTLTVTDKTLEAGVKYEYKICKDHAWDTAYPSNNASITVDETAIYTIVFTYNATTNEVSAVATKTGEAGEITHTYSIAGNPASVFGASWDQTATATTMTASEDANILTWTSNAVTFDAETKVEFKVVEDYAWGVAYPASNYTLTVPAGTYTITVTFNKTTKEVSASYTKADGISSVSAASTKTPIYNVAGQQISNKTKGLYLQNGKKYLNK